MITARLPNGGMGYPAPAPIVENPMRLALSLLVLLLLTACTNPGPPPGGSVAELQRIDHVIGNGDVATPGSTVTVHYTGWLYDKKAPQQRGLKFDSSVDRGQAFTFKLGAGQVIRGWDEGVAGMQVGGKRTLLIPAWLGYGSSGAGGVIPPNASLVFEVELLDVAGN